MPTRKRTRLEGWNYSSEGTYFSSLKRFTNRKTGAELWQTGYHDHIVRDEPDYLRIWQHIDNNPAVWLEDKYYSE